MTGFAGNSVVVDCSAGASGAASVTVPAGTKSIILFSSFWKNGTFNLTSVNINGVSASIQANTNTTASLNHAGVSFISSYTGTTGSAVNLNYVWSGAPTEGGLFICVFTDTTVTVTGTGTDAAAGSASLDAAAAANGTDLVLGMVESYTSTNPNGTPSGSDQTILHGIDNSLVNSDKVDLVQEGTTDTPTTHITGTAYYGCAAAVSLADAAAGGGGGLQSLALTGVGV